MGLPFCDGATFILYYDPYRIAEYITNTTSGQPVDISTIPSNPVVVEALNKATGKILQKARVGARYTKDQLTSLADDPVSGADLRSLCADIAYAICVSRKGYQADKVMLLAPNYAEALKTLDSIYNGDEVFDIGPALDPSGTTETAPYTPSPPNFPYQTQIAYGYYGDTGFRIWPGGHGPGPGFWPGPRGGW